MFKVGDVTRTRSGPQVRPENVGCAVRVLEVSEDIGTLKYQYLNGPDTGYEFYAVLNGIDNRLEPLPVPFEQMPPAPLSEVYLADKPSLDGQVWTLQVGQQVSDGGVWMVMHCGFGQYHSICISTETAKAMSADLLRMALAVEREQASEE